MNKKIRQTISFSAITVFIAGCASVAVTDDVIGQRTATSLGMGQGNFTITDRQDDGVRSNYTVKTKSGRTYSCYVTGTVSVVGRVVSDAVCSEIGGKPAKQGAKTGDASTSCNALLKAAGKC